MSLSVSLLSQRLASAALFAALVGFPLFQASADPQDIDVSDTPLEYSNLLDEKTSGATGNHAGLDPGQVLYTQPPDAAGAPFPRDTTDFTPGLEDGNEPDSQVDALAAPHDAYFELVVTNSADLLMSQLNDPPGAPGGVAVYGENPIGDTGSVYTQQDLNFPNVLGDLEDVDAVELWGPVGVDDALFSSWFRDATGTSIFEMTGVGPNPYLDQVDVQGAIALLGFTGNVNDTDIDGLMVKDANNNALWDAGDEVLFSIRATANWDGGEIVHWRNGTPATFLSHGGHPWDTAFSVAVALGTGIEEIDGLEAAAPYTAVSPASTGVPALSSWALVAQAGALIAAGLFVATRIRASRAARS
jgi:hypothetical protein